MRDIWEIIDIHAEEIEKKLEFQGEVLAMIHNSGYPYEGKEFLTRKDFVKLSWDEPEEPEEGLLLDEEELKALIMNANKHIQS